MIAALTGHEVDLLVLVVGVGVLVFAVYVAMLGRLAAAALIGVIGVVLLLLAS